MLSLPEIVYVRLWVMTLPSRTKAMRRGGGMRCASCGSPSRITDSRVISGGDYVRRRHECEVCSERFTSYQIRQDEYLDLFNARAAALDEA